VGDLEGLAHILGCKVTSLAMKYLCLPLGASLRLILYGTILLKK
jgi:hypothetical protein